MHCIILITDGNAEKNISLPSVSLYSSGMISKFQITVIRAETVKEVMYQNLGLKSWLFLL